MVYVYIYTNIGGILMGSMLPYIPYMDPMGNAKVQDDSSHGMSWVFLMKKGRSHEILQTTRSEIYGENHGMWGSSVLRNFHIKKGKLSMFVQISLNTSFETV